MAEKYLSINWTLHKKTVPFLWRKHAPHLDSIIIFLIKYHNFKPFLALCPSWDEHDNCLAFRQSFEKKFWSKIFDSLWLPLHSGNDLENNQSRLSIDSQYKDDTLVFCCELASVWVYWSNIFITYKYLI